MKTAILTMHHKSAVVVIALLRAVIKAMTGNANFPFPNPILLNWANALKEWEDAEALVQAKKNELKMAVQAAAKKGKVAMDMGRQQVAYVQSASGGNELIIRSAAMEVQSHNSAGHTEPPQVQKLSLTHNDLFGHIDAHWDAVRNYGQVWYNIRYTFDDPFDPEPIVWNPFDHDVSATTLDFSDHTHAGKRVWIQIRAVNATGAGQWSVAVSIILTYE